jgi:hypothetical protein
MDIEVGIKGMIFAEKIENREIITALKTSHTQIISGIFPI